MTAIGLLAQSLEQALNAYLRRDPDAAARLEEVEGKVLLLELSGIDLELFISAQDRTLRVDGALERTPDAILRGTPLALTRLALSSDPARSLASGDVRVEGDTRVGEAFRRLFAEVELDWEEALSRLVGDIPAHQMGRWARSLSRWGRRSIDSLRMDLTEYLQEESRALPTRIEIEDFLDQVDTVRADVDRLEARIRRLEQRLDAAEQQDDA